MVDDDPGERSKMRISIKLLLGVLFVVLFLVFLSLRLLTYSMLIGEYSFTYYKCDNSLVETPKRDDTLILKEDNKFSSQYWGNGDYRINHGLFSTQIILVSSGGTSEFQTKIKKVGLKKIVILLDDVCNQYYVKEI